MPKHQVASVILREQGGGQSDFMYIAGVTAVTETKESSLVEGSHQGMASAVPQQYSEKARLQPLCLMAIPIRHSDPSRIRAGPRTFFVTSSTWGKRSFFQSQRAASPLIEVLYEYRKQGKYLLHEFVIMPDHFHVLMGPESSIERAVQFIKGGFAFRAGTQIGLRAPIWQRGFSEIRVTTPAQFAAICGYIRENPMIRHLAEHADEFLYSSAYSGFALDPPPQGLKPGVEKAPAG